MRTRPALVAALALAAACGTALARDPLILPVDKVLAHPDTQQMLQGTVVRFGAPPADQRSWNDGNTVQTRSWARPYNTRAQTSNGSPALMNAEETCNLALRYTLRDLAQKARERGGQSVVEIVSYYENRENNLPDRFECHPGAASSVVTLRGRVAGPGGN